MRNCIVDVQEVQRLFLKNLEHLCGQRERVRGMIKQRVGDDGRLVEVNTRLISVHANGRGIGDEMDVVAAGCQFLTQLCSYYARAAVGGVASDSDAHKRAEVLRQLTQATQKVAYHVASQIVHRLDASAGEIVTRLSGKAAIVTGAGTGIGRAIAVALAREGARVAVASRRPEKLQEVAQAICQSGGDAIVTVCDVSSEPDTLRAAKEVEHAFGQVNVLVNNAGVLSASTVENISLADWDRLMATNLRGPFLMSRAVLPAMRRAGGGAIVNVGSILGLIAMRDRAAYCASKGGVTMLTKAMALDHAHEKIRVNCICPAIVETDLVRDLFSNTLQGHRSRESRLATLPLGRFGQPADVAELAVFLASEESSWMTGTAIPIDGGLLAY
jgi:NAD(P)-dependent dehydrogenase (short-subunit alcohol dehydrogenase family)